MEAKLFFKHTSITDAKIHLFEKTKAFNWPSGIKEERDLVNKLHQYGFALIRSPTSGGGY